MAPLLVEAMVEGWHSLDELLAEVPSVGWEQPTPCPGWTAKDQLGHLTWGARTVLGLVDPPVEVPDLPYLRNSFGRWVEQGVELRRGRSPDEVLAEYHEARQAAEATLLGGGESVLEREIVGIRGRKMTMGQFLTNNSFDQWCHEQDLRQAFARPGHLEGASLQASMAVAVPALVASIGRSPLPGGSVVVLDLQQPAARLAVLVADGQGHLLDDQTSLAAPVAASLAMTRFELLRRAAGRRDPGSVVGVTVAGDGDLARAVLGALSITP